MINTVLGSVRESEVKAALCHEHICCCSEYIHKMSKNRFDQNELVRVCVNELKRLKQTYGMNLFIDCTPVNTDRDVELLKTVSYQSGVHVVCSTGFYYTEEIMLLNTPVETVAQCYLEDIKNVNAGIIKAAVKQEEFSPFNEKLLIASVIAHTSIADYQSPFTQMQKIKTVKKH